MGLSPLPSPPSRRPNFSRLNAHAIAAHPQIAIVLLSSSALQSWPSLIFPPGLQAHQRTIANLNLFHCPSRKSDGGCKRKFSPAASLGLLADAQPKFPIDRRQSQATKPFGRRPSIGNFPLAQERDSSRTLRSKILRPYGFLLHPPGNEITVHCRGRIGRTHETERKIIMTTIAKLTKQQDGGFLGTLTGIGLQPQKIAASARQA